LWQRTQLNSLRRTQSNAGYFRGVGLPYLFLAPTLLSLLLFLYYPSIQTLTLSLTSRRFPLPQERFVCLQNYVTLAEDLIYRSSFLTTVLLTVGIVTLAIAFSLGVATLASQKVRGANVYRTLLIWPFALSPVVAGTIFLALFREGGSGLINYVLEGAFGISPSWLRDPALAPWVIVFASVWNIMGFNILFYIAGLQNIPTDLLEAAAIDGANRIQRFVRITFPLLAPFTFFLLVTNITYSFYGIYGAVDTLTQGGPPLGPGGTLGGATNVLIYKLYQDAFSPGAPVGLAAAQAVVLFLMVAALTLLQFRYVENRVTYSG
jgi:sn-glycerol 3-phosphate transport system permease protein